MNDGGPAFPMIERQEHADGQTVCYVCIGLTIRDWFAGMALQGLLAMCAGADVNPGTPDKAAEYAYKHADAMLAERNKQ